MMGPTNGISRSIPVISNCTASCCAHTQYRHPHETLCLALSPSNCFLRVVRFKQIQAGAPQTYTGWHAPETTLSSFPLQTGGELHFHVMSSFSCKILYDSSSKFFQWEVGCEFAGLNCSNEQPKIRGGPFGPLRCSFPCYAALPKCTTHA